MTKILKTIASVIILVCFFLPLSQCSMDTLEKVELKNGGVIQPTETIHKDIIISDLLFSEEAEISFESLILPIAFFIPLLFSLLPSFTGWKKAIKFSVQVLFSSWFAYEAYIIVFTIGTPLIAGWLLFASSVVFVVLCIIECIPTKHNKVKNLRLRLGRDKSRPF